MDDPRIAALVAEYTVQGKSGSAPTGFGDTYTFYVGTDDCHSILKLLISQETNMLKMNMFGYDDEELDATILSLIQDKSVHCQITLDRSQAGGVHEKVILTQDQAALGEEFSNSFSIGQSATHQISHTKGGVLVGQGIGWEGSMNWSASGEGTGIVLDPTQAQPPGFKAQNNTLTISTNPVFLRLFAAQLDKEHQIVRQQEAARAAKAAAQADHSASA